MYEYLTFSFTLSELDKYFLICKIFREQMMLPVCQILVAKIFLIRWWNCFCMVFLVSLSSHVILGSTAKDIECKKTVCQVLARYRQGDGHRNKDNTVWGCKENRGRS